MTQNMSQDPRQPLKIETSVGCVLEFDPYHDAPHAVILIDERDPHQELRTACISLDGDEIRRLRDCLSHHLCMCGIESGAAPLAAETDVPLPGELWRPGADEDLRYPELSDAVVSGGKSWRVTYHHDGKLQGFGIEVANGENPRELDWSPVRGGFALGFDGSVDGSGLDFEATGRVIANLYNAMELRYTTGALRLAARLFQVARSVNRMPEETWVLDFNRGRADFTKSLEQDPQSGTRYCEGSAGAE